MDNRVLGALIFLPGVVFAVANATASDEEQMPLIAGVAAVAISGAVGGAIAVKPRRETFIAGLVWSLFSVVFESVQVWRHWQHGSSSRATLAAALCLVRAAGVAGSQRGINR